MIHDIPVLSALRYLFVSVVLFMMIVDGCWLLSKKVMFLHLIYYSLKPKIRWLYALSNASANVFFILYIHKNEQS